MRGIVCALLMVVAGPALAADPAPLPTEQAEPVEYRDIVVDLGVGIGLAPKFPSSEKYQPYPYPLFSLKFLRLPVVGEVVTGKQTSFSIYPAINFLGSREEDDASYLDGVPDVDFSAELGVGAAFQTRFMRAFAEVRYGVTGHNGFVGEAGIDLIVHPTDQLELRAGPRVSVASDDYMDAYFSVPNSATILAPYEADGGFKDVGIAATAAYTLTEKWRLYGVAEWTHFVGDAGDSPIVDAGNRDELRIGVGFTYRLGLDLY